MTEQYKTFQWCVVYLGSSSFYHWAQKTRKGGGGCPSYCLSQENTHLGTCNTVRTGYSQCDTTVRYSSATHSPKAFRTRIPKHSVTVFFPKKERQALQQQKCLWTKDTHPVWVLITAIIHMHCEPMSNEHFEKNFWKLVIMQMLIILSNLQ